MPRCFHHRAATAAPPLSSPRTAATTLSGTAVAALFGFVMVAWGLNWVTMKVVVREVPPVWAVAWRSWIALAVLLPATALRGQLMRPPRHDLPVVLVNGLLHMAAFAVLMTAGLQYVTVGRSIVLGYTTPLWVTPAAYLVLHEPLSRRRALGVAVGLGGLLLLFDPRAFDWHDDAALLGNGLVLGAALCWSVSIICLRAHRWAATPFQLALWQTLVAATVLTVAALALEGRPHLTMSGAALAGLLYNGAVGSALGFWAMAVVNKELPAVVTSLGVLATPVVGMALSALLLGETIDATLVSASLLILGGIALGVPGRAAKTTNTTTSKGG